jgi:hypothetical protein
VAKSLRRDSKQHIKLFNLPKNITKNFMLFLSVRKNCDFIGFIDLILIFI